MKSFHSSAPSHSSGSATSDATLREQIGGYYELSKPRLSFMSVVTAIIGYLAADPSRDFFALFSLIVGTSLAAGGAAALNQWMERDADSLMERTKDRPIPAGQVSTVGALVFGISLSIGGTLLVTLGTNQLAGFLTALTVLSYVLLYTPLKTLTVWNTVIGAIPGAIPPLIGWAAAEHGISTLGWLLFSILFFWQLPHFYAIAWTYRDDYARGGFVMLSATDSDGHRVAVHSLVFSIILFIAILLPFLLGYTSFFYGAVAIVCGIYILRPAIKFFKEVPRDKAARRLFFASIFFLPALLVPLVLDLWLIS